MNLLKVILTTLLVAPFAVICFLFIRRRPSPVIKPGYFGMGVNYEREPQLIRELIRELGVNTLLVRFPLSRMEGLDDCVAFLDSIKECTITIKIIQDRDHVESSDKLEANLRRIFQAFRPYCRMFIVGNAVNRRKWSFYHIDEYLRFYGVAQRLKDTEFPELVLIGPSVIDFEYHYTIRALYNLHKCRFDIVNALLYVDRRGAPENRQLGFDLGGKILLMRVIQKLSPKCGDRFIITEANWPLKGTAPYAPTGEKECVSEDVYASYMVRYYLLAFATGGVESIYWHQLIAPGYGLVDHRDGTHKYKGFDAYKTLVAQLGGARFVRYRMKDKRYAFVCRKDDHFTHVLWSSEPYALDLPDECDVISRDGRQSRTRRLTVSDAPVYVKSPNPRLS